MTKPKYWLSILAISIVLIAGSLAVSPIAIAGDDNDDDDDDDDGAAAGVSMEWLACRATGTPFGGFPNPGAPTCNLITGIALNDLVGAPPAGTLAVLEPDTFQHTSTWESAPLAAPLTILPGSVTLDLVMMNHAENTGPPAPVGIGDQDVCWSKHAILPGGAGEIVIVAPHCFENPLPAVPNVCPFGGITPMIAGTPDITAACIALAQLVSETVPSLILAPTVIPAGSVIELNIFCPGSSFIGVFFNAGIDVDGDGILDFSKVTENVDSIIGGTLVSIDTTTLLLAGAQSISLWMIPVVAAGVGVGVFVIKRRK